MEAGPQDAFTEALQYLGQDCPTSKGPWLHAPEPHQQEQWALRLPAKQASALPPTAPHSMALCLTCSSLQAPVGRCHMDTLGCQPSWHCRLCWGLGQAVEGEPQAATAARARGSSGLPVNPLWATCGQLDSPSL